MSVTKDKVVTSEGRRVAVPMKGEHWIVREEMGKPKMVLVKVLDVNESSEKVRVVYEKDCWNEECVKSTFPFDHLYLNLGKNPEPQRPILGNKIEIYQNTVKTKLVPIHFFAKVDDKEERAIKSAFKRMTTFINDTGLKPDFIMLVKRWVSGKYLGFYHTRGDEVDHMTILLKDEFINPTSLTHLMFHELGHGLYNTFMTLEQKATWIKAFHQSVSVSEATEEDMLRVMRDFLQQGDEYSGDEKDEAILGEALAYINDKHNLTDKEISMLVNSGDDGQNLISTMWPKAADLSDQDVVITEYANKNSEEFWAEALAHWSNQVDRAKLPKNIVKLVDNTIKQMSKRVKAGG